MGCIACKGDFGDDAVDEVLTADPVEGFPALEFFCDGDEVNGFAFGVHIAQDGEDDAEAVVVEVVRFEGFDGGFEGFG